MINKNSLNTKRAAAEGGVAIAVRRVIPSASHQSLDSSCMWLCHFYVTSAYRRPQSYEDLELYTLTFGDCRLES